MVLDKNANIITEKELAVKMDEDLRRPEVINDGLEYLMRNDPGRWATMHGYDAIHVEKQEYMIVLNRSKVTVQKEPIKDEDYYKIDKLAGRLNSLLTKKNEIDDLDKEFPDDEITPEKRIQKQKLVSEITDRIRVMESEITQIEKELKW
jgi:hypothetical protein